MDKIHLGRKSDFLSPAAPESDNDREYFPTLHLSGGKELKDLPESGRMLVEFDRTSLTVSEDKDGEKTVSVTLAIKCICRAEKSKMQKHSERKTEDVLDALMEKVKEEMGEEEDED